jgi:hypothetical protein
LNKERKVLSRNTEGTKMAPSALLGISNQRRRKRKRDSRNSSRSELRNGPTRRKE